MNDPLSSLGRAALMSALCAPVWAQRSTPGPDLSAPTFVEEPGVIEFRGVLTARPVQPSHALEYGWSEAQYEARRAAAEALLLEASVLEYIPATDESLLDVGLGNEQKIANLLMASGGFHYVAPDWTVYPAAADCTDDPFLSNQWHHDTIESCAGWAIETGDPSVTVAVCDTGQRITHTEFQQNRKEGYNAVNQLWESQGGQISDLHGHGTQTSGLAIATGNNANGVAGVGWDLSHRILRISNLSSGSTSFSTINHAVRTASDAGDRVVNVSYNGVEATPSNDVTGAYVRNQGGLVVWAAGNSNVNLPDDREDNLIVVGGTTIFDAKWSGSNFGPMVDLVAPGSGIFTTSFSSDFAYTSNSGTSFSSPMVAGLLALMWTVDPSLTPQEAEDRLRAGCDDIGDAGLDDTFGYGRINVRQTLEALGCGVENYCTALPNTTGMPAVMTFSGSVSVASNDLVLTAARCPANQFGLFFFGDAQNAAPSGDGTFCVGGSLVRYGAVQVDGAGFANQPVDVNSLPNGLPPFLPGETTNFSFWFRDTSPGGWNFADGLSVKWCD